PAYEFRHSLYREVLYRKLPPAQRVKLHRCLAEAFEALGTRVEEEMASELAMHFEEGRDYERALRYLIIASENETYRYAHRESIEVLQHARELLSKVAGDRVWQFDLQTLERIGKSYYALGEMDRSAEIYRSMATRTAQVGQLSLYVKESM